MANGELKFTDWNCRAGQNNVIIRTDGTVAPCFPMYSSSFDWGNIDDPNFDQQQLKEMIDRSSMFEEIVGSSKAMRQVLHHVEKVAPSDSTVLILGETGTGKELIAHALHRRSKRADRAFIQVNCAAIPQSLIASELFGHEKRSLHRRAATERGKVRSG